MKRILSIAAVATLLSLLVAAPASAAPTYHGSWESAGWAGDPAMCPFPPEVPASGNWNVTLMPDGHRAVVHMTMFTATPDRIHVDSWGGMSLGSLWTVDSATAAGFAIHVDVPARGNTEAARFTFVLDDGTLTFTIAPWVVQLPFGTVTCEAATAAGPLR
jgi:hypothetical protein